MKEACPRCGSEMTDGVCPACGQFHTLMTPAREGEALAGRYILVQLLGRGGMGLVYLAQDTHLGQQVALKLLPPEVSGDISAIEALKKEVLLARQLHHENIAALYNFETDPDRGCFIVMEFIDGADLTTIAGRRQSRRLSVAEVVAIGEGIAAALDYAHKKGIIHRDIKPKNIMLSRDGVVKVTDFGIAKRLAEATMQTHVSGTLPYMSPEVLRGRPPSPAADIYAFAATLYELLAGHPPFHKGDLYPQILNEQPPPIDGIPQQINHILRRGLSKSPNDRYPTAGALYDALRAAAGGRGDIGDLTMAIPKRTLKVVKEAPIDDLISRAKEAEKQGDFSRALALLHQAMRCQPKEEVREMIYAVEKRQKEFYSHLEKGDEAQTAGRYKEALEAYRRAQKVRDSDMLRQRMAAAAKALADSLVASGEKALRHHSLKEAERLAKEALEYCPDHEGARGLLGTIEAIKSDLERHLEAARKAFRGHDYEGAISAADEALQLLPSHPEALALKKEAQHAKSRIESLMRQAEDALNSCRHAEAVRLLEEVNKMRPDTRVGLMLEEARALAAAGSLIRPIKSFTTPSPPRAIAHSKENLLASSDRALLWLREETPTLTIPLPRTPLFLAASDKFVAFVLPDRLHILPSNAHTFLMERSMGRLRPPLSRPHWIMRPFLRALLLLSLLAALLLPTLLLRMGLLEPDRYLFSMRIMLFILPLLGLVITLLVSPRRSWIVGWSHSMKVSRPLGLSFSGDVLLLANRSGIERVRPSGERGGFVHFLLWFVCSCVWLFGLLFGVAFGLKHAGYGALWRALGRALGGLGLGMPPWQHVVLVCLLMRFVVFVWELWMRCGRRLGREGLPGEARLGAVGGETAAFAVGRDLFIRGGDGWVRVPAAPETLHANGEHIAGLVGGDVFVWSRDGTQVCRFRVGDARKAVVDGDGVCVGVLREERLAIYRLPHKKPAQVLKGVACVECAGEVMAVGYEHQIQLWQVAAAKS